MTEKKFGQSDFAHDGISRLENRKIGRVGDFKNWFRGISLKDFGPARVNRSIVWNLAIRISLKFVTILYDGENRGFWHGLIRSQ